MDTADLRAANPSRPPDWRWQLAQLQKNDHGPVHDSARDEFVCQLFHYLTAHAQSQDQWDEALLAKRWPDFYNALQLSEECHAGMRNEIEARILAGASDVAIAQRTFFTHSAIKLYHALFFDVRDRRNQHDWINQVVIRIYAADADLSEAAFWKWCAYYGGEAVLDAVMGYGFLASRSSRPADPAAFLCSVVDQTLAAKSLYAALTLPCAGKSTQARLNQTLERVEKLLADPGNADDGWRRQALAAMRCSLRMRLTRPPEARASAAGGISPNDM